MNPNRTYEENMAALKKVLTQRTYTALSHRNIEFVLKYQNASLQELAAYLRRQQAELRHIPGRTEIIGGDFIELRFRGSRYNAAGPPAPRPSARETRPS